MPSSKFLPSAKCRHTLPKSNFRVSRLLASSLQSEVCRKAPIRIPKFLDINFRVLTDFGGIVKWFGLTLMFGSSQDIYSGLNSTAVSRGLSIEITWVATSLTTEESLIASRLSGGRTVVETL